MRRSPVRGFARFRRRRLVLRCCRVAIHLGLHVADEAQALARDGADQLLALAIVAHRLARGVDPAGQSRIRHDAAAPHRRDEIVLRDDTITVLHNVDQQVEYLRLHCNGFGAAAQLAPLDVKRMIGKDKLHVAAPTGLPGHPQYRSRNRQNGDDSAVPVCDAALCTDR